MNGLFFVPDDLIRSSRKFDKNTNISNEKFKKIIHKMEKQLSVINILYNIVNKMRKTDNKYQKFFASKFIFRVVDFLCQSLAWFSRSKSHEDDLWALLPPRQVSVLFSVLLWA